MTQLFANLIVERTPRGTNENTQQLQEPQVSPSQGLNLPPCASNTFKLSKNLILNLAGSPLLINDQEPLDASPPSHFRGSAVPNDDAPHPLVRSLFYNWDMTSQCEDIPHRHTVFTIPKCLRAFFQEFPCIGSTLTTPARQEPPLPDHRERGVFLNLTNGCVASIIPRERIDSRYAIALAPRLSCAKTRGRPTTPLRTLILTTPALREPTIKGWEEDTKTSWVPASISKVGVSLPDICSVREARTLWVLELITVKDRTIFPLLKVRETTAYITSPEGDIDIFSTAPRTRNR